MTEIRFGLVGPGRVGRSLALWLAAGGARLEMVAGRDPVAAAELARTAGAQAVDLEAMDSSGLDLLLLTVADAALPTVSRTLAGRAQAAVALHVSGASGAEVIEPLRRAGCRIGTLHPLRAFPQPSLDAVEGRRVVCTIDGDAEACALAETLVESFGGVAITIDAAARPLYHLAASLAAGGVVTLLSVAREISERLELPPTVSDAYFDLAHQALSLAQRADHPAMALTGPVARGDADVVIRQLDSLERAAPELLEIVTAVARETLRQRRRSATAEGSKADAAIAALRQTLSRRGQDTP